MMGHQEITDAKLEDKKFSKNLVEDLAKEIQPEIIRKSDTWFLQFTILIGVITWVVGGAKVVWSSPALIKLQSTNSSINPLGRPITTPEVSLMFGIPGVIALPGSFIFPKLADVIGRKICVQIIGFTMFISLTGLAFSNTIELIISCLTIFSIAFAGVLGVLPMYLTELCEDHNRAKYGCLTSLCLPLGQLYAYVLGPLFIIRDYTLLLAAPLIPFLICFFFVPESPVYSLTKGRAEECKAALKKLQSNKTDRELELQYKNISQSVGPAEHKRSVNILKIFTRKEGRYGLFLSMLGMLVQTFAGGDTLLPLLGPIYNNTDSILSGDTIAIIVEVVSLVSLISTVFIVERVGRRPLLIISAVGSGVPMIFVGLFFYFQHIGSSLAQQFYWVPLTSILIYFFMYCLGLGSIPLGMVSVFFNMEFRSTGTAIVMTVTCLLLTIFQSVYPLVAEAIGTHWCMWMFATFCFVGAILMYLFLPETTGKSVEEIQEILMRC